MLPLCIWHDPLMAVVRVRHSLLVHKRIPLDEVLCYPLVLGDPQICEEYARQVDRLLRHSDLEPLVAERVALSELIMTLPFSSFALGLTGASQFADCSKFGVAARLFAGRSRLLTTYLLRFDVDPSETIIRFIECAHCRHGR